MDVEKIQRINNLARELERQGLADGREDAVAQARRIFNVKEESPIDVSQMRDGSLQAKEEGLTEEVKESSEGEDVQSTTKIRLNEEKISTILKKNSEFLVTTIKNFQAKIDMMESQMAQMNRKLETLASRPVAAPAPQPAAPTHQEAPMPQQPVESNTTNPQGGDHPRSGGYNDSDVSIEKFFYMGK